MNTESILKQIQAHQTQAGAYYRMVDIASGNISQYVLDSIKDELKPESYIVASKRIAPINVYAKIVSKLSKVYSDVPKRTVTDPRDQELVTAIEGSAGIQSVMANAELMLNINRQFALEPYLDASNTIQVRVLAPYEFMVLSDDPQNPNKPTTFVKFMGKVNKGGNKTAQLYWIYTKDTYTSVDSDGQVYEQLDNPYGVLPFVYCSQNTFSLMAKPDVDSFNVSILVPKLLTDLCVAVEFQSHSVMYGIDIDPKGLQGGPDAFWSISSKEGATSPSIGVLSPTVDVEKVLSLVTYTVSQWLNNKGIKPGSVGTMQPANAASAVSKIVDEADTSQVVQRNRILLVSAEKALWRLIGLVHNTFLATSSRGLSEPLNVSVSFPVQQVIVDPAEKREQLKFELEQGLTTLRRALKQSNPDLSDDEIEKLKEEIEQEKLTKAQ
jgi:hypothetical protein